MKIKKAIYPGTFDPITLGHLDIIGATAQIMDELVVAVLCNSQKAPVFSAQERIDMIVSQTKDIPNVTVRAFDGLLVDLAKEEEASFIIRGLRAVTDFEYEMQMTHVNKALYPEIHTIFMAASLQHSYISSSIVREIAAYGGDISNFVTEDVAKLVNSKLNKQQHWRKDE